MGATADQFLAGDLTAADAIARLRAEGFSFCEAWDQVFDLIHVRATRAHIEKVNEALERIVGC